MQQCSGNLETTSNILSPRALADRCSGSVMWGSTWGGGGERAEQYPMVLMEKLAVPGIKFRDSCMPSTCSGPLSYLSGPQIFFLPKYFLLSYWTVHQTYHPPHSNQNYKFSLTPDMERVWLKNGSRQDRPVLWVHSWKKRTGKWWVCISSFWVCGSSSQDI